MSDETVESLRREIESLRAELVAMRAAVEAARMSREPTMRSRLRCPACGHATIAHAQTILDRGDGDARKSFALYQPKWWSGDVVGEIEAYICTRCGLVEWYVKEPASLRPHDKFMAILDGSAPDPNGPYR